MAFGLTPWDPFRELDRLDRMMRRGFESPGFRMAETIGTPAIELTDEGDHYLVKAELPGVDEKDVDVTLSGNVLTIRGEKRYERREEKQVQARKPGEGGEAQAAEKKEAAPEQGKQQAMTRRAPQQMAETRPIFSEVYYGRFERVITLPDDIDPDQIEASSKNGVVTLRVGKKPEQRARRIDVTRH